MGLAQIRSMPPPDSEDRSQYDFQHAQDHIAIVRAIFKSFAVNLPSFQLWPIVSFEMFLLHHQQMHFHMNRTLVQPSSDLSRLDAADDNARADWSLQNFQEHLAAHQALKLN
jgi:hypothetical protein